VVHPLEKRYAQNKIAGSGSRNCPGETYESANGPGLCLLKRFILFHNKTHPSNLGTEEISAFLSHLAIDQRVAASTQNQALNASILTMKGIREDSVAAASGRIKLVRCYGAPTNGR
jgi:hypothetical protein